jgi:hypothetical protein
VEIPARIEQAVTRRLEIELAARGLLLTTDELAAAEAEAAQRGAQLLRSVVDRCYPGARLGFESDRAAERLAAALVFGAETARVLGPPATPEAEVLCAIFNLGIGLVDNLCDDDAETGLALLELVQGHGLVEAAEHPRARGWLRAALPQALARDHTAAFTADIVETFFAALHDVFPGDERLQHRRLVGERLEAALDAERASVLRDPSDQLLECSRLTSVLPFQIIEILADGDRRAGTLLGEAMWRIDDLVDLRQDAGSGALNSILLAATNDLEADVGRAAAEAAEKLRAGLAGRPGRSFLYFIQRYASIPPSTSPRATRRPRPAAR